jgi:hypothetical protein
MGIVAISAVALSRPMHLRTLLIHGAHAVLVRARGKKDRSGEHSDDFDKAIADFSAAYADRPSATTRR